MHIQIFTTVAVLATCATAKTCVNATVPVTISAQNGMFNILVPSSNSETIDFVTNVTRQGGNFTAKSLSGYQTVSGTYNISTQYCTPSNSQAQPSIVQVLTHGIGFDKTYWDLSYNNFNYSYVDYATNQGYSTLSYDRLGIGNSSHGDALEIQAPLEIAALVYLTEMLRNGTFPGNQAYSRVVHVGHSFGSGQTYSLANMYPQLSDGIILTGFSTNGSFLPYFVSGANLQLASVNQPLRFSTVTLPSLTDALAAAVQDLVAPFSIGASDAKYITAILPNITAYIQPYLTQYPPGTGLPAGYLVSGDEEANQYLFLQPGAYDPALLDLAERTKQPVTVGELLTVGSLPPTNNFPGPVLVLTGDNDVVFCGGNCSATGGVAASIPAMASQSFPNVDASNFSAVVLPNFAHGINLHYNSTGAYDEIQRFLDAHGLSAN